MIHVTGDTHGHHDFGKLIKFVNEHPGLTKSDYIIICGDFGAVWSERTLEESLRPYQELPVSILFVDGNHENFSLLDAYPLGSWNGGRVHFIKPDIIHLMRGQVFEIEGKTFFTFGGGTSIDKWLRQDGVNWWERELPSREELDEGVANLRRYNNTVDYIITHSCDERALWYPAMREKAERKGVRPENLMLSYFERNVRYTRHWYFGHYHIDARLTKFKTAIYQKIVPIW